MAFGFQLVSNLGAQHGLEHDAASSGKGLLVGKHEAAGAY